MSLIEDLVKELPKAIQEMVRAHLVTITKMNIDETKELITQLISRHYEDAYQTLNDRLSPEERLKEQGRLNTMIEVYNKQNANRMDMWRNFFIALITIGLMRIEDKVIE